MFELRIHDSMRDIPAAQWDALAGGKAPPFVSHTFLDVLERTGCVGADKGWLPLHLTLWQGEQMVAAAPAYLKGHSEGEFVFDYAWAEFARRIGVNYYPKLLVGIPFTPATGSRVLCADSIEPARALQAMAEGLRRVVDAQQISSAHVLFSSREEALGLERAGMALRYGMQYHWENKGYDTFEDFLSMFSSKRRNQIRRERKEPHKQGVTITTLRGEAITGEAIEAMYGFYLATVDKFRWGRRYLNREFFFEICQRLPNAAEIVLARHAGRTIAGAFNLVGEDALFGRYWGATEELPFLHFNVCYYHSIEQCILRKLRRFEPGAGGEHKKARGFLPTITYSSHILADRRLDAGVRDYLAREREHVERVVSGEEPDED
jgi:predicted N-acyltransferase